MSVDLNTSERNVTAGSVLIPGLVDLEKFMLSDRYHLSFHVNSSLSLDDGSHAVDNLFQSLQDVSFVVVVECLPEGESRVI